MDYIEVLGTGGTRTPDQGTTCIRVSEHCVIDAGNLIHRFGHNVLNIEHIFLTHAHLDHIIDVPFLADLFVTQKSVSLKVYGLRETLDSLRRFIFNDHIWPNFEEIVLIGHTDKTIQLIELQPEEPYNVDGITLTPFKTDHTEGSCGYIIEKNGKGMLFSGDTYRCARIWEILDERPHLHTLITEVSFPSHLEQLAYDSKHLTPALLTDEFSQCQRNDFTVHAIHLKVLFSALIIEELNTHGLLRHNGKVLNDGDRINYSRE